MFEKVTDKNIAFSTLCAVFAECNFSDFVFLGIPDEKTREIVCGILNVSEFLENFVGISRTSASKEKPDVFRLKVKNTAKCCEMLKNCFDGKTLITLDKLEKIRTKYQLENNGSAFEMFARYYLTHTVQAKKDTSAFWESADITDTEQNTFSVKLANATVIHEWHLMELQKHPKP